MLQDLVEDAAAAVRIPEIIGERCVHSQMEMAQCSACVDACPTGAWHLDEELLGIDPEACDGCGLCAPACPEGAIVHDHEPFIGQWKEKKLALAACERAGMGAEGQGIVPCMHALGLRNLITLYMQGCDSFFISHGDCEQCARGSASRLQDVMASFNGLLSQRGLPALGFRELPPTQWLRMVKTVAPAETGITVDRRNFFRHVAADIAEQALQYSSLEEAERAPFEPPGKRLPTQNPQDRLPYVPEIDITRCNGCDACARLCPHQAIGIRETEDEELCYAIDAQQCTGCGLCTDVCQEQAVSVQTWAVSTQRIIILQEAKCHSCNAPFHGPVESIHENGLCRICHVVDHNRNLYQVLD